MSEKINWLEWGQEAFEKARKEKKPILMDIFGTWCHWCHRIEEDTYQKPEVIKQINRDFIAIRVDTDKRPDINERYNQGGWPTTAFLDHEGNVITGATYLPPEQMLSLLDQVKTVFENGKRGGQRAPQPLSKGVVTEEILLHLEELAKSQFDPSHGGFGEPQFPLTELLEFLLVRFEKTKRKEFLEIVEKSLQGMIAGIYDKEEGGFYRYSVTRNWKIPHYEKMLETNAGIVRLLSLVYKKTNKKIYLDPLKKTVSYLLGTLADPAGGFYASQDADGEDAYYGKPLAERGKMETPFIDKTVFVDLNGLMVRSLLVYYQVTKDEKAREFAEKTIALLLKDFYEKERRMAHYLENNKPIFLGLLRDQVNVGLALIEGWKVFKRKDYLTHAQELAAFILKAFHDGEGGFFDTLGKGEGKLAIREKRLPDNARAAMLFLELGKELKNKEYQKIAEEALEWFAIDYKVFGLLAGEYALAVEKLLD